MSALRTVAPGKAILCGEYAVLHGAPAISVAVDRFARAGFGAGGVRSPFVVEALERAGAPEAEVTIDSAELYDGERKLGFGSSAAVTVATVGLAWAHTGRSLAERRALFEVADEAHAAAQGTRGSGIDVATSVWGGVIRFQRAGGQVAIEPVSLPDEVHLTFVFTGKSASTAELIGRVKALAERAPAHHEAAIGRLVAQAHAFATAVTNGDAAQLLRAADAYFEAMAHLGEACGAEIVTREHAELAALARRHGGVAKPSGAGGGDLGVAFTVGLEATAQLRAALEGSTLQLLDVSAPAPGLRLEKNA